MSSTRVIYYIKQRYDLVEIDSCRNYRYRVHVFPRPQTMRRDAYTHIRRTNYDDIVLIVCTIYAYYTILEYNKMVKYKSRYGQTVRPSELVSARRSQQCRYRWSAEGKFVVCITFKIIVQQVEKKNDFDTHYRNVETPILSLKKMISMFELD